MPLADLDAVEAVFASIIAPGNQHGWRYFDIVAECPPSSLHLTWAGPPGTHTFDWSNQCVVMADRDVTHWCLEGMLRFTDLVVLRADGTAVPEDAFTGAARRWWDALHARDPRLSTDAQRAAHTTSRLWREWR